MEIIFKIEPYPKRTAKMITVGKYPRMLKNEKTRIFENAISLICRNEYRDAPLSCPVKIDIKFFMTRPKTVKKQLPDVKPDLSNLIKSLEDGCNGILWEDDSQICQITASKEYSTGQGFIVLKFEPII